MGKENRVFYEGLTKEQLSHIFREIADRLEGISTLGEELPYLLPDSSQKLKVTAKNEIDGFSLKIKLKNLYDTEDEKKEPGKKTRYKQIKKRMMITFKEISESLENNTLPDESAVISFLQDSRLMTSFSEYGAEFFSEYDNACGEFRRAFENREMQTCKAVCSELRRLKHDCHKRHR